MLAKYAIAGVAGSALLASVAFAQGPSAQSPSTSANTDQATTAAPAAASDAMSLKGSWRTSKLVGLSVYNDKNESLGSINDLLADKNGDIKAVVLGVGGFLGVGEHLVAVPLNQVKFVDEPIVYTGTAGAQPGGARPSASTTTGAATTAPAPKKNPWYPDHAVFNATRDQLKSMPEFKYSTE
jgi:sporulation protein YlmC with PRC-barrel domain